MLADPVVEAVLHLVAHGAHEVLGHPADVARDGAQVLGDAAEQAATALRWAVDEMERRYQLFANAGTKNITTYNAWVKRVHDGDVPPPKAEEVEALL